MEAYIITEGGEAIGFGHLTRCISIYQAFEKRGMRARFIINGDKTVKGLMKNIRHEIFDWIGEKERLLEIIKNKADLVIVDSYLAELSLYKKISGLGKTTVYIDDSNRLPYPKGIVVNATVYAKKLDFRKNPSSTYLLGKDYALFRKEFWDIPAKKINRKVSIMLVFLGGTDSRNLTVSVLKQLGKKFPDLNKIAIIGKGTGKRQNRADRTKLLFGPDAKTIRKIMLSSDIAITTGGLTLYELAKTGVPAVAVAAAENQMMSIRTLDDSGLISYAGSWKDKGLMEKIANCVDRLQPYGLRHRRSARLRKLFNKDSTLRLADKLIELHRRYENEK